MTFARAVAPETLDALPVDDPRAVRSRGDLRRIHVAMGTTGVLARALREALPPSPGRPLRVLELGAGDGRQMLAVARRLAPRWPAVELTLLDRLPVVAAPTLQAFAQLGWTARGHVADVFDWAAGPDERAGSVEDAEFVSPAQRVGSAGHAGCAERARLETPAGLATAAAAQHVDDAPGAPARWDAVVATLFLHHFTDAPLARLLAAVAARCNVFLACEPRRGRLPLLASRLVGALGANAVTREDAVLSVRAGFRGAELSALWPGDPAEWQVDEHAAAAFSHVFRAVRRGGAHRADAS